MTENILQSNMASALVQISEQKRSNDFDWQSEHVMHFPGSLARRKVNFSFLSGVGDDKLGSTFDVQLPKYGFLERVVVRMTHNRSAVGEKGTGYLGIFCFSKVELVNTSGTVIETVYDDEAVQWLNELPTTERGKYVLGDNKTEEHVAGATDLQTFYEIPFKCMRNAFQYWDLIATEQLALRFYSRPYTATIGGHVLTKVTSAKLMLYYSKLPEDRRAALIQAKHPGGAPFSFISLDTFKESEAAIANAGTLVQIPLRCKAPILKTFIVVRLDSDVAAGDFSKFSPITNLTFSDAGSVIWDSSAEDLISLENPRQVAAGGDNQIYVLNHTQFDKWKPHRTSLMSLDGLSNPTLTITTAAATARTVKVYHIHAKMLSVEPSVNGLDRKVRVTIDK